MNGNRRVARDRTFTQSRVFWYTSHEASTTLACERHCGDSSTADSTGCACCMMWRTGWPLPSARAPPGEAGELNSKKRTAAARRSSSSVAALADSDDTALPAEILIFIYIINISLINMCIGGWRAQVAESLASMISSFTSEVISASQRNRRSFDLSADQQLMM